MNYKGFKIEKASRYVFHGFDNSKGYYYNVNYNFKNARFDTLREAKEFVNNILTNKL